MSPKQFWKNRGCPKCGAKRGSKNKMKNAKKLAEKKDRQSAAYDLYPPIGEYMGVNVLRVHKCKSCGHIGEMKPDNFWHNERGCPICGAKKASQSKRLNNRLRAPERDQAMPHYKTYPPVTEYIGAFEHRTHLCKICGYEGKMIPNNFYRGRGCPICADSGFDKEKPAILYYLKVEVDLNLILYKIGITNKTVKERYNNSDLSKITIIKTWRYQVGKDALLAERKIKDTHSFHKYKGIKVLQSGNSELFTKDILNLALN
ncbi:hypothetical protein [Shewanella woodyi]|uniref:hypothetical protein n=1 Tax=Shewanella woodyi TaxID=60961 RepID=UPI00374A0CDD